MAGYSGTPLAAKLGIFEQREPVLLLSRRAGGPSSLEAARRGQHRARRLRPASDQTSKLAFFTRLSELEQEIDALASTIFPAASLWLAWPKKASRVETDLSDNHVRACALERGLVDNKVCALDETWSAL